MEQEGKPDAIVKAEIVLTVAWHYLGRPYIWGGDDPDGFDCSGLVIECLKSVGVLPREGDWTAETLYQLFKKQEVAAEEVRPGDLVLWEGADGKMVHVEIVLYNMLSIGASGGGSWAVDAHTALAKGAFIKIRPFSTRAGKKHFVRPYA
jgi:cell wall-associated NlpC family hydrolase